MNSRTKSSYSSVNSVSEIEDPHSEHHDGLLEYYQDYDVFQAYREIDTIIENKLYLGGLPSASAELRKSKGITHILSVCSNFTSTGPNHLQISVLDDENENLLIHLPKACQFIQNSLDDGGRVLVHCMMGVSRSATVMSAYLMWARHWAAADAISFVQKRRQCVHPNYGFIRQLQAFQACGYNPSPTNDAYQAWKRSAKRDVTCYLNVLDDTVMVQPYNIYLNSELPKDREQGNLLLADIEITHLLTISPSQSTSIGASFVQHHHINISNTSQEALLLALPEACNFIRTAVSRRSRVLVHCRVEMRACIVIAAFLMSSKKLNPQSIESILRNALPLFEPTLNFNRHLELFDACAYVPTIDHPAVKAWMSSADTSIPAASCEVAALTTAASRILVGTESPSCSGRESPYPTGRTFDMSAFSEALVRIQKTSLVGENAE